MKTKEKILEILNDNCGNCISGEEIARKLSITRNAVWKGINSLKKDGYDIESVANSGYVLNSNVELFSENTINKHLKTKRKIIIYEEIPSTNIEAKTLAQNGACEGDVVIAKSQSAGKGRMGRSFISNSENGLYMSIILKPHISLDKSVYITVLGAVAVLEAIEETSGKSCHIKWVNDIYINERKVSGILTEASIDFETSCLQYAILGIGINITPPENGFHKDIENIATSIYSSKECPKDYKSILCAKIIDKFFDGYKDLEKKKFIEKYRQKSMLIGKEIEVQVGNEITKGTAIDVDENAHLVVKTKDGIRTFNSGEARARVK
ncbi:MAG: biotin--[Clostridia bacterium]|nr:biotin--[acetyl-CoA-carboxylase] ligase [Clostridia bacterium]